MGGDWGPFETLGIVTLAGGIVALAASAIALGVRRRPRRGPEVSRDHPGGRGATREPPKPMLDERAPDGRVEVATVLGVEAAPNPLAPEYRRFGRLLAHQPAPITPRDRPWGRAFPALRGRVAICSLFLGRDGRGWTDREVAAAHRALVKAGQWLEREAGRWRVPVNVELADVYFEATERDEAAEVAIFRPEGGEVGPHDPDAEGRIMALLARAAGRLGFVDPVAMLGQVARRIEADHRVWLLHIRRSGNSLALTSDATGIPGVAVAACYAEEDSFEGPMTGPVFADPITFVHELLHLFGAVDKYDVPAERFPRSSVSERDVMCLNFETLSALRVDPLTSFEIGWASSPSDRPEVPTGR